MKPAGNESPDWDKERPFAEEDGECAVEKGRATGRPERVPVVVVGVQMSFDDLIGLLVKLALAAIPAAIILSIIFAVVAFGIGALLS